jgi:hypothetical protein
MLEVCIKDPSIREELRGWRGFSACRGREQIGAIMLAGNTFVTNSGNEVFLYRCYCICCGG